MQESAICYTNRHKQQTVFSSVMFPILSVQEPTIVDMKSLQGNVSFDDLRNITTAREDGEECLRE